MLIFSKIHDRYKFQIHPYPFHYERLIHLYELLRKSISSQKKEYMFFKKRFFFCSEIIKKKFPRKNIFPKRIFPNKIFSKMDLNERSHTTSIGSKRDQLTPMRRSLVPGKYLQLGAPTSGKF